MRYSLAKQHSFRGSRFSPVSSPALRWCFWLKEFRRTESMLSKFLFEGFAVTKEHLRFSCPLHPV